jgi:hypothetical protein
MGAVRPWLPLLRRLTDSAPTWGVWKRPEAALEGDGDVDALASTNDWPAIVREYRWWSHEHALGPVVVCTHIPGILVVVACDGERPTRLLQMDVSSHRVFRGSLFVSAEALGGLMLLDRRGFRRLRSGAEGVLLLVGEGVRRGAGPPDPATVQQIAALLRDDPDGVEEFAAILGRRGSHVHAAASALAQGRWDRRELVLLELKSAARLLGQPRELATCIVRDLRALHPCLVTKTLEADRLVLGDRDGWLADVERSHVVYR